MGADPVAACASLNVALNEVIAQYRGNTIRGNEPHKRLAPLLRLPDPLAALLSMLERLRCDRPRNDAGMQATRLRDEAIAHISVQKGLRRKTLCALTCGKGGSLRRENGDIILEIKSEEFKNRKAKRFEGGFYREKLQDVEDCYETIDRWLHARRTLFVPGESDGYLFVTRAGNRKMIAAVLADRLRQLTGEYLCKAEFGPDFEKIIPFGPHGSRHVLATYFLKRFRDLRYAAEAIDDDVKTVRDYYARYVASDLKQELEEQWAEIVRSRR